MKALLYAGAAVGHIILVAAYWFFSEDPIGTVLLLVFGVAMALMVWILAPTIGDVGPTAPVDPEWHERNG